VSPLRGDVLVTGFVLAVPVLALGLRGELSAEEVVTRLLWCLAAGWAAVTVLRFASTPRGPVVPARPAAEPAAGPPVDPPAADDVPAP